MEERDGWGFGHPRISNAGLCFPPSPSQFPLPEESQLLKKGRLPPINVSQKLRLSHYSAAMASFISPPSARLLGRLAAACSQEAASLLHFCRVKRFVSGPPCASLTIPPRAPRSRL